MDGNPMDLGRSMRETTRNNMFKQHRRDLMIKHRYFRGNFNGYEG